MTKPPKSAKVVEPKVIASSRNPKISFAENLKHLLENQEKKNLVLQDELRLKRTSL